jgi:hypothetical protein
VRITGVSTLWGGLSWEYRESDADVVQRLFNFLEDRRVLSEELNAQTFFYVGVSVKEIRDRLTQAIDAASKEDLRSWLKAIQAELRHFNTSLERIDSSGVDEPWKREEQILALGEMRGRVNLRLGFLAETYGIEVEEDLAAELQPPQTEQ